MYLKEIFVLTVCLFCVILKKNLVHLIGCDTEWIRMNEMNSSVFCTAVSLSRSADHVWGTGRASFLSATFRGQSFAHYYLTAWLDLILIGNTPEIQNKFRCIYRVGGLWCNVWITVTRTRMSFTHWGRTAWCHSYLWRLLDSEQVWTACWRTD